MTLRYPSGASATIRNLNSAPVSPSRPISSGTPAQWFQLAPIGEHLHTSADGKTRVQVIDDAAVQSMVNNFRPKVLVDQEHFSYDSDKSSEAFGWLVEVESRPDGLYGRIDWTDYGERAVANARYRFISPVWLPRDLEKLGGNRVRPLRLDTLGLTNTPNITTINPLLNCLRRESSPVSRAGQRPQMIANRAMPQKMMQGGTVITSGDFIEKLRRATGSSFEEVWNSSQPILNRFANREGAVEAEALWTEALGKEQAAFDATFDVLQTSAANNLDRGHQLHKGVTQPRNSFLDAVRVEMARQGVSFEKAWDFLKESEPLFFLRHVWAMTEPVGGRGW